MASTAQRSYKSLQGGLSEASPENMIQFRSRVIKFDFKE